MDTKGSIKLAATRAIETRQPQEVNGWSVSIVNYAHRFGTSRYYRLADRFDCTVVEIQGLERFARLSTRFVEHFAPGERHPKFWLQDQDHFWSAPTNA